MERVIYYVPMLTAAITLFITGGFVRLDDPRLVTRPGGPWHPLRVLDDSEWTPEGLIARRRLLRSLGLALVATIVAWSMVLAAIRP